MSNFFKIIVLIATFFLGFGQVANAWTPDKEVEIVAHAKETSSTVAFARGIIKVIEEENLLPNGVKLTIIRGARGGKARNYVLNKNKSPHVLQVLTPSQINNAILRIAKNELNVELKSLPKFIGVFEHFYDM